MLLRHCFALLCALALAGAVAGCGSDQGSETFTTAPPGKPRFFGDRPGQEETDAAIGRGDCRALRRSVEGQSGAAARVAESEPSPPSSRCVVTGSGLRVSIYLDAAYAARQRYLNRMTEQVQFYAPDPARIPHSVRGVGDPVAGAHSASWIPAYSTLYAVRGNRWITVAYSAPGTTRAERKVRAVALARRAFRLTAR
ncbi:MAG TPA: hypothetical protein VN733_04720 [Solirubrobacterales bacterium]|nr:hypothetical protein [Solirubrobacterales bacterium]